MNLTLWSCSMRKSWGRAASTQRLHWVCGQAGMLVPGSSLKNVLLAETAVLKMRGKKWIQNLELACSYEAIRKVGCSTWAASCIFWVLAILRPSYSHGPNQCFDTAQSGCLLLLTARACAPKCILSTECKWTWHFKALLLQKPRFLGIAMQQNQCCSPQLKLKMLHRKTYHVKVRFTWDLRIWCFFAFPTSAQWPYLVLTLLPVKGYTFSFLNFVQCALCGKEVIFNANGLHVKGKHGLVYRTWYCCKRSNQNLCSVLHWGFFHSFEKS